MKSFKCKTVFLAFLAVVGIALMTFLFTFGSRNEIVNKLKSDENISKNNLRLAGFNNYRKPGSDAFNQNGPSELNSDNSILINSGGTLSGQYNNDNKLEFNSSYNVRSLDVFNGSGEGTLNKPYLINTADRFIAMLAYYGGNNTEKKYFKLEKSFIIDLDENGSSAWFDKIIDKGQPAWEKSGWGYGKLSYGINIHKYNEYRYVWNGDLDGNENFIWFKSYRRREDDGKHVGKIFYGLLFADIHNDAVIHNTNFLLTNIDISQKFDSSYANALGIIAGRSFGTFKNNYFYLDNIYLNANADGGRSYDYHVYVGGLLGAFYGQMYSSTFEFGKVNISSSILIDGAYGFGAIAGTRGKEISTSYGFNESGFRDNLLKGTNSSNISITRVNNEYWNALSCGGPLFGTYDVDTETKKNPSGDISNEANNKMVLHTSGEDIAANYNENKINFSFSDNIPDSARNNDVFEYDRYRIYILGDIPMYNIKHRMDGNKRKIKVINRNSQNALNDFLSVFTLRNNLSTRIDDIESVVAFNKNANDENTCDIMIDKSIVLVNDISNLLKDVVLENNTKEYDGNKDVKINTVFRVRISNEYVDTTSFNQYFENKINDVLELTSELIGNQSLVIKQNKLIDNYVNLGLAYINGNTLNSIIGQSSNKMLITKRHISIDATQIQNHYNSILTKEYNNNNIVNSFAEFDADVNGLADGMQSFKVKVKSMTYSSVVPADSIKMNIDFDLSTVNNSLFEFDNNILIYGKILPKIITIDKAKLEQTLKLSKIFDNTVSIVNISDYDLSDQIVEGSNDVVSLTVLAQYIDKNVANDKNIDINLALSGDNKDNYKLSSNTINGIKGNIFVKQILLSKDDYKQVIKLSRVYREDTTVDWVSSNRDITQFNDKISASDVSIKILSAEYDSKNQGRDKIISGTLEINGEDKNNYQIQLTFTIDGCAITKRTLMVPTILGSAELEYNGQNQQVVLNAVDAQYLNISHPTEAKNVGKYYVRVDILDKDTYEWDAIDENIDNARDLEWSIIPKSVSADFDKIKESLTKNKLYDGNKIVASDKYIFENILTGVLTEDVVKVNLISAEYLSEFIGNNKEIKVIIDLDNSNYNLIENEKLFDGFIITKRVVTRPKLKLNNFEYNANEQCPEYVINDDDKYFDVKIVPHTKVGYNYEAVFSLKDLEATKWENTNDNQKDFKLFWNIIPRKLNVDKKLIEEMIYLNKVYDGTRAVKFKNGFSEIIKLSEEMGLIAGESVELKLDPKPVYDSEKIGKNRWITVKVKISGGINKDNYRVDVPSSGYRFNGRIDGNFVRLAIPTLDISDYEYSGKDIKVEPKNFDSYKCNISGNIQNKIGIHLLTIKIKPEYAKDHVFDNDEETKEISIKWTIVKAKLKLVHNDKIFVYNGHLQYARDFLSAENIANFPHDKLKYENNTFTSYKEGSELKVKVTYPGNNEIDAFEGEFGIKIEKALPKIKIIKKPELSVDGTLRKIPADVAYIEENGGDNSIVLKYAGCEYKTYDELIALKPYVIYPESDNYKEHKLAIEFAVKPMLVNVELKNVKIKDETELTKIDINDIITIIPGQKFAGKELKKDNIGGKLNFIKKSDGVWEVDLSKIEIAGLSASAFKLANSSQETGQIMLDTVSNNIDADENKKPTLSKNMIIGIGAGGGGSLLVLSTIIAMIIKKLKKIK